MLASLQPGRLRRTRRWTPFDGTGIGRCWPLLAAGERGHYEVAAKNFPHAEKLVGAIESFANESGLLPEQIWESADLPEKNLYCGRPSGSAMPLVSAHAEYVKLRRSLHDRHVFDLPPQTVKRYVVEKDRVTACSGGSSSLGGYPRGKIRVELLQRRFSLERRRMENGE